MNKNIIIGTLGAGTIACLIVGNVKSNNNYKIREEINKFLSEYHEFKERRMGEINQIRSMTKKIDNETYRLKEKRNEFISKVRKVMEEKEGI